MKNLTILITTFICLSIFSHGGGLNKDGCHNERKTGGYHCHRTKSPSIHDAPQPRTFKASEKSINLRWCDSMEGIAEFRTKDGTYVDCLTGSHAIETEFGNKWKEAIGQSLHYAESTKKKAGILLIQDKNSQVDYLSQLQRVIEEFQLPITLYVIEK